MEKLKEKVLMVNKHEPSCVETDFSLPTLLILGADNCLLLGAVLGTVGYLVASLASTAVRQLHSLFQL